MYFVPYIYPSQYSYVSNPQFNTYSSPQINRMLQNVAYLKRKEESLRLTDYGSEPLVLNINQATKKNKNYRTAIWTGKHLQVTLMSLKAGEDVGLEMHPDVDQFLRVEQGQGIVQMGSNKEELNFKRNVLDDYAIMIPAGTWHNLTNTGNIPLKVYSIYAPPNHPFGTVHSTKAEAVASEENHHQNMGN